MPFGGRYCYNGEMEYVTIQQTEAFQKAATTISAGLDLARRHFQ